MRTFTIESEDLIARVEPAFGGSIGSLAARDGTAILRPTPEAPKSFADLAMYPLCPWSNRIAEARFEFKGVEHRLRPDWPDGSAIDGVLKEAMVSPIDRTPVSARLMHEHAADNRWPWSFRAEVRHEVDGPTFASRLTLTALDGPMPAGLGWHPHFAASEDATITCPGLDARYPAVDCLPTGPPSEDATTRSLREGSTLGELDELDDCFAGSLDGAHIRTASHWVMLGCSDELTHGVVYTGNGSPKRFVCLKPMSHATNAVNLPPNEQQDSQQPDNWQPGVRTLGAGETMTSELRITVRAHENGGA